MFVETETRLWRCIEDYANRQAGPFQARVKPADIARATGLSEQLLSKWRYTPTLPKPGQLAAVRDGVGVPYNAMLEAALSDRGWLPEPARGAALTREEAELEKAARVGAEIGLAAKKAQSTGRAKRRQQDKDAEAGGA